MDKVDQSQELPQKQQQAKSLQTEGRETAGETAVSS